MSSYHAILIVFAGLGAGAINAVVGSGTLITFPTLVAMGYPPVTATMSNAVGLVAGSVSGTWGYRRELRGQWPRLRWQIPASLIGSVLGACLLFGLLDAAAIRLQGVALPGIGEFPVQAVQALPYLLTVVLLAGFVGRTTPPLASGQPYMKER